MVLLELNFCVLQCKPVMKKISNRCYECRRQRQLNSQPQMSDLPSYRFSVKPVAFKETGVDFFGALWNLPPDQHSHESLLLLVHLSDNTSRSYRSNQKFAKGIMHNGISTILQPTRTTGNNSQWQCFLFHQYSKDLRGKQLHNYRDTEICGIEKNCKEIYSTRSSTFLWNRERLIGMSKRLFFNITGSRKLQEDSFSTLICQVEALLNSRPLTSVSSDIRDVESLTPGHFLTGMTTGLPSDTTISGNDRRTGKLWNNVNSIMNEFWTRLLKAYLPTHRQRRKWHSTVDGIEVGDMVWILENNTPRGIWPVGRVQKVNKGNDNVVRSCLVKTSKGDFVKPAIKLSLISDKST